MNKTTSQLRAAKTIVMTEAQLPESIPQGHVRLQLATASLCGTDLHYYKHFSNAGFEIQRALTLGHEACAYVTDTNGSDLNQGDLVALNPIIYCGQCDFCEKGEVNHCSAKRFPGSATCVPHIDGFFRAQFDFPAFCCHPVPAETNPDHLTFAEALSCAMHAVKVCGIGPGDKAIICGCGPMGLLAVVAAKASGAIVDVTEVRPEAIDLALAVGASKGFEAGSPPLNEKVDSYDAVIEASGSPHAFNQSLELVKRQGRVAMLSSIQPSTTPINLHKIMLKEIEVAGSFQFNSEFENAISLIISGHEDFDKLIAATFSLQYTSDAFKLMDSGRAAGKILLKSEL